MAGDVVVVISWRSENSNDGTAVSDIFYYSQFMVWEYA